MNRIIKGLIIFLVIILISIVWFYNSKELAVYNFPGDESLPSILITGGVHGDEPSGSLSALELVERMQTDKRFPNTVTIIPRVNEFGLDFGIRNSLQGFMYIDMNRQYPIIKGVHTADYTIIQTIMDNVQTHGYSIDLHEGNYFHLIKPSSIGSTIYFTVDNDHGIAKSAVDLINEEMQIPEEKHFSLLYPGDDEDYSLSYYCYINGFRHFLIETTGKRDIQPLDLRMKQHLFLVNELVNGINSNSRVKK